MSPDMSVRARIQCVNNIIIIMFFVCRTLFKVRLLGFLAFRLSGFLAFRLAGLTTFLVDPCPSIYIYGSAHSQTDVCLHACVYAQSRACHTYVYAGINKCVNNHLLNES